ncbi:MAG: lysylphosphatidylglycerol synthase transmembrane domain-containing protein [Vampirovibrionales bacterium]|nr:lysylphosphatidylglycerol synthase transmembrane domain-containing protein [Vampirovibrionales bacterium]
MWSSFFQSPMAQWLLKAVISGALLWVMIQWVGLEALKTVLKPSLAQWILAGVGLYLISQAFSSLRWYQLATALIKPIGQRLMIFRFFGWYLLGMFYSLFLPSAIGGDAGRVLWLSRFAGVQKRTAFLSVLAERGVGFLSLIWLAGGLVCMPDMASHLPQAVSITILSFAGLSLAGWGALLWMRQSAFWKTMQRHPLGAWLAASDVLWCNPRLMVKTLLLAFAVHACMGLILTGLAFGLHLQIAWSTLLLSYVAASIASLLPFSLNGLGVREGVLVLVLTLYGVDRSSAVALSVSSMSVSTLTSLLGGVFWPLSFSKATTLPLKAVAPEASKHSSQSSSNNASSAITCSCSQAISLEAF